jgi:heat-inducible transcriptional repressor
MSMTERQETVGVSGSVPRPPLTERQRAILRLIVQEYSGTGRPVGSKSLTERYDLGLSSATIRNDMSELEHNGLVQHLHTSGGRVPTVEGYRYFVRHLMGQPSLPSEAQIMIRHQFQQPQMQLEGWIELAASVLASAAGNVSVVSLPRTRQARIRHFELISLQPRLVLLVVVTGESMVRQGFVHLEEEATQAQLRELTDLLLGVVQNRNASELESYAIATQGTTRIVLAQLITMLSEYDAADRTEIHHQGLEHFVGQRGIEESDVQRVIGMLNGGSFLNAVLPRLSSRPGVQVFIGDESLPDELRRFGLVIATYGIDGAVTGLLGVIGPTRMSYLRTVPTVRYMAGLMSDLMVNLIGEES